MVKMCLSWLACWRKYSPQYSQPGARDVRFIMIRSVLFLIDLMIIANIINSITVTIIIIYLLLISKIVAFLPHEVAELRVISYLILNSCFEKLTPFREIKHFHCGCYCIINNLCYHCIIDSLCMLLLTICTIASLKGSAFVLFVCRILFGLCPFLWYTFSGIFNEFWTIILMWHPLCGLVYIHTLIVWFYLCNAMQFVIISNLLKYNWGYFFRFY